MTSPIFIVGAPRSGTTLLRLLLCNHPSMRGPHEFPLVELALRFFEEHEMGALDAFLDMLYSNPRFAAWELPRPRLSSRLCETGVHSVRAVLQGIFEVYVAERRGLFFVDKNIGSLAMLPKIKALFPDARFIHIVRDGRDVALSLRERPWGQYQLPPFPKRLLTRLSGGALLWLDALTLVDRFKRIYAPELLSLRYEDLVRDPRSELSRVCGFLGLEYAPAMLDYYKNPDATISGENMRASHAMLREQVTSTRSARHLGELTPVEKWQLQALLGRQLRSYGYSVDNDAEQHGIPDWIEQVYCRLDLALLPIRRIARRWRGHVR